jgi:type II secretory pathway pseudopilin PulG
MRHRSEAGETLIEVILTIVLVGITVGALIAGLGTAAGASKQHRDLTTADGVLRSFAEATKDAVRSCTTSGLPYTVVYTPPSGFTAMGAGTSCPSPEVPETLTLTVTDAKGHASAMQIVVRTP